MITLNEKEKRAVAAIVQERTDEHLGRFPYTRYPVEPLEKWRKIFCEPASVPPETIKKALGWHFGGWQRQSLPSAVSRTIAAILKVWPEFLLVASSEPQEVFRFWKGQLLDWSTGFSAAAFLIYLQRPNDFELMNRHRMEAIRELLRETSHSENEASLGLEFTDLEDYTSFFRSIIPKLPYKDDSRIKLDRFLKAYGNRHAYKLVSPDFRTTEPTIRTFTWDGLTSERFRMEQIVGRANSDVLFACFLLSLEAQSNSATEFTVGEVVDMLPVGTAGICNEASFNYALISLFSQQRQRDFWVFDKPEISRAFTEQANQSTRDMRFYQLHAVEKLQINSQYLNSEN
jgi:AraC-like DNA-binding protein